MERSTHTLAVRSRKWFAEALISLVQKKPYGEITVSELCEKAGLDRRTFYRNFKNKNDVLSFYIQSLQEDYLAALKNAEEHTFFTLAKVQFEFWRSHLDFLKSAQIDQSLFVTLMQTTNEVIPTIYTKVSGGTSRELQYNIAFVAGGFHNVLIRWISSGFRETPEELATIVSNMFKDTIDYWPVLDL